MSDEGLLNWLKRTYDQEGISGLRDIIVAELRAWKSVRVNIAVTGKSGSGKSAFLNALRDLKSEDVGGAEEGVVETTTEIKDYQHPENVKLKVWDVPGIGTDLFPRDTYISKIQFDQYDFFIIISDSRFTEDDEWLAQEIEKRGKTFFFVRSKFGLDVSNKNKERKKRGKPEFTKKDEEDLKQSIIDDIKINLKNCKSEPEIFVIDSHQPKLYDFQELKSKMIFDAKDLEKQEALAFTLKAVTKKSIEQKKQFLEKRIWRKSLSAAFAHLFSTGIKVLLEEQQFYKVQLRLDDKSLEHDISETKIAHSFEEFKTLSDKAVSETEKSELLDEMKSLPPFVPAKFYGFSKAWLTESLETMVKSAMEVHTVMATAVVGATAKMSTKFEFTIEKS